MREESSRAERGKDTPRRRRSPSAARSPADDSGRPDKPGRDDDRERRTTTESPRRSASPKRMFERDGDEYTQLPTRSKPISTAGPTALVSFKVKSRDGSHGPEAARDGSQEQERRQQQQQQQEERLDGDRMDEDPAEDEEVVVEDEGLEDMAAMMGFGGFGTTKGQKVLGNNVGAARKEKRTKYRQYMNRIGGFNRPLSPTR